MSEWKPIESAPKSHTLIALLDTRECDEDGIYCSGVTIGYWADVGMFDELGKEGWINWWESDPGADRWSQFHPTHWMPLPSPPTR